MDAKASKEETLRAVLEGIVEIAERLAPICGTVEELVGMASLALTNDAQLRMILKVCSEPNKRGP